MIYPHSVKVSFPKDGEYIGGRLPRYMQVDVTSSKGFLTLDVFHPIAGDFILDQNFSYCFRYLSTRPPPIPHYLISPHNLEPWGQYTWLNF